jgi:hypothetical protein
MQATNVIGVIKRIFMTPIRRIVDTPLRMTSVVKPGKFTMYPENTQDGD